MANKYIIHGATFNGDGTSSAEAASDGAAGAWNNINILTGTAPAFGSLAAGDVVTIRSKDASGANLTITVSANSVIGSAAATSSANIEWWLDDGSVWPGIDGTLTFTRSTAVYLRLQQYNIVGSDKQERLIFVDDYAAASLNEFVGLGQGSCLFRPWLRAERTDYSGLNGPPGFYAYTAQTNARVMYSKLSLGNRFAYAFSGNQSTHLIVVAPTISLPFAYASKAMFSPAQRGGSITVYGGSVSGAGADAGAYIMSASGVDAGVVRLVGLKFPVEMQVLLGGSEADPRAEAVGMDVSGLGAMKVQRWGYITSRDDGNFPTLNANYPDSVATAWSWFVRPSYASPRSPVELPVIKLYTEADAAKTVTLEFLAKTGFDAGLTLGNTWMDVHYINASTGEHVCETTLLPRSTTSISASAAAWSSTAWGAVSCTKKKLTLTTANAIKQDTPVTVVFWSALQGVGANDVLFVCPDVQLSAP